MSLPVLYSFRRCPYAMRARLAILVSGVKVILREVKLSDKPEALIRASKKAEVPVLVIDDQQVIDESIDIMLWALQQNDPDNWLDENTRPQALKLIRTIDAEFKPHLDHYKYWNRFPENSQLQYRQRAEEFLSTLEQMLTENENLLSDHIVLVDMAVIPFIRQFAGVEPEWFQQSPYQNTSAWLNRIIEGKYFPLIMKKYPFWQADDPVVYFPEASDQA